MSHGKHLNADLVVETMISRDCVNGWRESLEQTNFDTCGPLATPVFVYRELCHRVFDSPFPLHLVKNPTKKYENEAEVAPVGDSII